MQFAPVIMGEVYSGLARTTHPERRGFTYVTPRPHTWPKWIPRKEK